MFIYLDRDTNSFKTTNEPEKIALESCMQEIGLWQGENPMDIEMGVDYFGIMDGYVYLRTSIENITDKYKDSFQQITVYEPQYNQQSEIISIAIEFLLKDLTTDKRSVQIGTN